MKNISTVEEMAMSSPSPLGDASLEDPNESVKKVGCKTTDTEILAQEDDHEVSFKTPESDATVENGCSDEAIVNGASESAEKPQENGDGSRPSSPVVANGNASPVAELSKVEDEISSHSEKEEEKPKEAAEANSEDPMDVEDAPATEKPSSPSSEEALDKAEKVVDVEPLTNSNEAPTKMSEICLEPAGQSSSEESADEDSSDKTTKSSQDEAKASEEPKEKPETLTIDLEKEEDEEPKEQVDYKKALEDLNDIAANARKINEEDGSKRASTTSGIKRTLSTEVDPHEESKKPKLEDLKPKSEDLKPVTKAEQGFKKCLQKLTREELEEVVLQKFAEVISARSEIGELRRKCDLYEEDTEKWKKRAQLFQKMCSDLNTVMKRYIVDVQAKPNAGVTPIKITRSVGLQVVTDRGRRAVPAGNQMATKTTGAAIPPAPVRPPVPKNIITPTTNASQHTVLTPVAIAPRPTPITYSKPASKTPTVTISPAVSTSSRLQGLPSSVSIIHNTAASPATSIPTVSTPASTVASSPQTASGGPPKKIIDVVDLSDEEDEPAAKKAAQPSNGLRLIPTSHLKNTQITRVMKHPAPLPDPPRSQIQGLNMKSMPPKPTLKISKLATGIVLSWNMTVSPTLHAAIGTYQIYAYQETSTQQASSALWKKVGDVKALPLPMACTLTQFSKGNKYHFAVRAKDVHGRVGYFSDPQSIALT